MCTCIILTTKRLLCSRLFFQKAGNKLVAYSESKGTGTETMFDLSISMKNGPTDFCTQLDVQNEEMIIEGIRKEFPTHELIGEESTGTGPVAALTDTPTWVIDPIDGTTNFAAGLALTCVSIALCVDKRPVVGVIYAPITNELYLAVKGHGAFRNGQLIFQRLSNTPMSQAVVCCEFGYPREVDAIRKMVGAVERILQHGCRAVRALGSGCLDLCYVATGRLDVVYAGVATEGWHPWDYAAGLVICQESGAVMEAIDQTPGQEFDLYSKSVICAVSRDLLEECRRIITAGDN
jgi:fructose-1,6-bisphosphatase/inositol monophosphatase family enzyme